MLLLAQSVRLLLLLNLAVLLAACETLPEPQVFSISEPPQKIYLIRKHWHTSILLKLEDVLPYSSILRDQVGTADYVQVGWGDGDYFTGKSKSAAAATKALFISSYSALQLLDYNYEPFAVIPAEERVQLWVSRAGLKSLVAYIEKGFARDRQGNLISLEAHVRNSGYFYLADRRYSLFSNCNTWSAQALQAAGLPIKARFRLAPSGLFEQAQILSRSQLNQAARTGATISALNN